MSINTDKILVIGSGGQIGVELTLALRKKYGNENIIASDLKDESPLLSGTGTFYQLDVLDKDTLLKIVQDESITQIYLLAAVLSAAGEQKPLVAWNVNMQALLNVLEIARNYKLKRIFFPSSIAVFGPTSPKKNCPQHTIIEPTTAYGISKYAGENWCEYYFNKYGVDVRSIRYPGIISYKNIPGGGTTDYSIDIFYAAKKNKHYTCFLNENTCLPMMYMDDAVNATIELMEAPLENIKTHRSYNLAGISFSPKEIASEIQKHIPDFTIDYIPDFRQEIADSWPQSINDSEARSDWHWRHQFDLAAIVKDMLEHIR